MRLLACALSWTPGERTGPQSIPDVDMTFRKTGQEGRAYSGMRVCPQFSVAKDEATTPGRAGGACVFGQ